jgi:hypothetical protein
MAYKGQAPDSVGKGKPKNHATPPGHDSMRSRVAPDGPITGDSIRSGTRKAHGPVGVVPGQRDRSGEVGPGVVGGQNPDPNQAEKNFAKAHEVMDTAQIAGSSIPHGSRTSRDE